MSRSRKKSVVVASQGVTLRDFVVFQVKLALDGVKDFVAINLSVVAIVVDLIAGRGRRPRRFYAVVRMSRRFDRWLNLHGMKAIAEAETTDADTPFETDADALIGQFEERVKESKSSIAGARRRHRRNKKPKHFLRP